MTTRTPTSPQIIGSDPPLVLIDVDGVLLSGRDHRPQMQMLTDTLVLLGFELVAWSAGGADYARSMVEHCGLHGAIRRYLSKPDAFPIPEADALAIVGRRPVLQIDDDAKERVADWPFMWVETYRP